MCQKTCHYSLYDNKFYFYSVQSNWAIEFSMYMHHYYSYLLGSTLFLGCVWHMQLKHCTMQASCQLDCWKNVCYQGRCGQYLENKIEQKNEFNKITKNITTGILIKNYL